MIYFYPQMFKDTPNIKVITPKLKSFPPNKKITLRKKPLYILWKCSEIKKFALKINISDFPYIFQLVYSKGFIPKDLSQRIYPKGCIPEDLSQRTYPKGFIPKDLSQRMYPKGCNPKDVSQRIYPKGFVPKDLSQRIYRKGFIPKDLS